jgi:hypothetical protein
MSLRADVVFSGEIDIYQNATAWHDIEDPQIEMHKSVKLLMIIITSTIYFDYLIFTIHKIVFLLNPFVWKGIRLRDVDGDNTNDSWMKKAIRYMYISRGWMMLPALFALLLRFIITYVVIVDSIGIILTSHTVKDTIFDCLTITFIVELNSIYWRVLHTIFHFMPAEVTQVKVRFAKNYGKRPWESRIVSLFVFFLGMRQFSLVAYAIDTNVSPMTRDICTQWRFHNWTPWTKWVLDRFTWIDTSVLIEKFVNEKLGENKKDFCEYKHEYSRTELTDMMTVASKYPLLFAGAVLVLVAILLSRDVPDMAPKGWLNKFTFGSHLVSYQRVEGESKKDAEE